MNKLFRLSLLVVGAGYALLSASAAQAQSALFICLNSPSTNLTATAASACAVNAGNPIFTFSFGVSGTSFDVGTGVRSPAQVTDFSFFQYLGPLSPVLLKDMISGTVIPTVVVGFNTVKVSGGVSVPQNITLVLSNVHVTQIQDSQGGDGSGTVESVALSYSSIQYFDNSTTPVTTFTWPPV